MEPYVSDALRHIHTRDVGAAAYAIEVVLRGSRDGHQLRQVLDRLVLNQDPVLEHAIRTLAGEGLVRLKEIVRAAGWSWAIGIVDELGHRSLPRDTLEELIFDMRRERQILGFVLATLASETSGWAVKVLKRSKDAWVREYADWLTELFEHSWQPDD